MGTTWPSGPRSWAAFALEVGSDWVAASEVQRWGAPVYAEPPAPFLQDAPLSPEEEEALF